MECRDIMKSGKDVPRWQEQESKDLGQGMKIVVMRSRCDAMVWTCLATAEAAGQNTIYFSPGSRPIRRIYYLPTRRTPQLEQAVIPANGEKGPSGGAVPGDDPYRPR